MKKTIAIILCCLMTALSALLASCSLFSPPDESASESESGKETGSSAETYQPADLLKEAQERIDTFRELDFAGKKLTLVCPYGSVDIYQPSDSGTSLSGARTLRNLNVAGAVGVDLTVMYTRGDIVSELRLTKDSGDVYADFVSLPQNRVGVLAKAGYLQNLVDLPYAAVRSSCYNNTAYSQSSPVYGVYGDFNFDPSYLNCIYFNEKLCAENGIDPQALYSSGNWTVEEFLKILRALDGKLENASGFAWMSEELGSENRITDLIYAASGLKYMRADGDAFADISTQRAESVVSAAREMISLRRLSVTELIYDGDAFKGGGVCFYADSLAYSLSLPASLEWSVLPIPSADGGRAPTLLPQTAEMLCVPTPAATEACGAFLGAFAAFSDGYIPSMFLRDVFNSSARTSSVLSNMKEVTASAVCDLAFIEAPAYTYAAAASYGAVRTAVKSGRTVADITEGVTDRARAELGR